MAFPVYSWFGLNVARVLIFERGDTRGVPLLVCVTSSCSSSIPVEETAEAIINGAPHSGRARSYPSTEG